MVMEKRLTAFIGVQGSMILSILSDNWIIKLIFFRYLYCLLNYTYE